MNNINKDKLDLKLYQILKKRFKNTPFKSRDILKNKLPKKLEELNEEYKKLTYHNNCHITCHDMWEFSDRWLRFLNRLVKKNYLKKCKNNGKSFVFKCIK